MKTTKNKVHEDYDDYEIDDTLSSYHIDDIITIDDVIIDTNGTHGSVDIIIDDIYYDNINDECLIDCTVELSNNVKKRLTNLSIIRFNKLLDKWANGNSVVDENYKIVYTYDPYYDDYYDDYYYEYPIIPTRRRRKKLLPLPFPHPVVTQPRPFFRNIPPRFDSTIPMPRHNAPMHHPENPIRPMPHTGNPNIGSNSVPPAPSATPPASPSTN